MGTKSCMVLTTSDERKVPEKIVQSDKNGPAAGNLRKERICFWSEFMYTQEWVLSKQGYPILERNAEKSKRRKNTKLFTKLDQTIWYYIKQFLLLFLLLHLLLLLLLGCRISNVVFFLNFHWPSRTVRSFYFKISRTKSSKPSLTSANIKSKVIIY